MRRIRQKRAHAGFLLFACAWIGCGGAGARPRAADGVQTLTVTAVDWNPTKAPIGHVRAVAETGEVVAVFADEGATVFASRAVVASDHSVKHWALAGAITGADGSPSWIVGVSAEGRVYHLRGLASFEDVSDRYGLGNERVLGAAVAGPGKVVFLLDGEVALADGRQVSRYAAAPFAKLVGGGGFAAGVSKNAIVVLRAADSSFRLFPLRGVTRAALGADGRLYASTRRAIYAADEQGFLSLVYVAESDLRGLVASGGHVWFIEGTELGTLDGGHVAKTAGARLDTDATLAPSPRGDVWVVSSGGLQRFASQGAPVAADPAWDATIAPIFAKACVACHLPDGPSGTDLSTAPAWSSHRALIRERVVAKRSMPPEGHALSDADREAVRAWVDYPVR